jgi:glycosyltransferase involved in cell wall biosynthesis
MNKKRVSVAMATYNGEAYIFDQLKSILEQTVPPDEIVICDDLSEDNTKEEIYRAQRFCNIPIKFYQNKNRLGYSRNFLNCIAKCSGDIIALSDQDDIWKPHKLEKCTQILTEHEGAGALMHTTEVVNQRLNPTGKIFPRLKNEILQPPVMIPKHPTLGNCIVFKLSAISSVLNHFLQKENSFPEMLPGHDDLIHFFIGCRYQILTIKNPLILYRRHQGNISGNLNYNKIDLIKKTNFQSYKSKEAGFLELKNMIRFFENEKEENWSQSNQMTNKGRVFYKLRSSVYSKKSRFLKKNKFIYKLLLLDLNHYPKRKFYSYKSLTKDIISTFSPWYFE